MKKYGLQGVKSTLKYMIYVASIVTACYGFWGSLFPDLTFVEGTYRVVGAEEYEGTSEELFADILEGRVSVTYSSKVWEIIKNRCGFYND